MVSQGLRSQLVDAVVDHKRLRRGQSHAFQYRVFYGLIDLEELPQIDKSLWTFSSRGFGIYGLSKQDFINFGHASIKENIAAWLLSQGHSFKVDRVLVFAHLRSFGINFNPLSVFFIESSGQTYCVAEVDNTFGEAKLFFLGALDTNGKLLKRIPKHYYVSPFIEHDTDFLFEIRQLPESLFVQVTTIKDRESILMARMEGALRKLNDRALLGYLLRMPLTPIKVFIAIHWQAARLIFKKVPFFRKQEFPELQRDYYVRKTHTQHIT
ncbi:MAG: DUF1365 domain-containing protein [Proteobacteria bacterium]|nr:DUF1365 domain-containing protein [Pseudomonadota bacterium]